MSGINNRADSIQKGLIDRPAFSIRIRIAIGFLLTFVLTFGTTIIAMIYILDLVQKQRFIENASNFEFEIQQARRYEKAYFLYNTNLVEARLHIQKAHSILIFFENDMRRIMGDEGYGIISDQLLNYGEAAEELAVLGTRQDSSAVRMRRSLESDLRIASSRIVTDYLAAIERERLHVRSKVNASRMTAVIGLVLVLALQIVIATFVIGHVIRPFKRFEKYFKRIAEGDFSLIQPARKYRDEFSDLAIAVNSMLTELEKRQDQVIQSRKMGALGSLTAGIAHELNNPLNNIAITIEALLDEFEDISEDKKRTLLEDAFNQTARAGDIVKNLLDFSRFREASFTEMSINDVITISAKMVANQATLKNIRFQLDLDEDLPALRVDQQRMQQVFINIFINAIQAMADEGEIGVRSFMEDRHVRIDVSDTGPGIPPEVIDKIFDPFFTTKEVGKGTGLGLSVVYGIIKKHDGTITAENRPVQGATFSIKLPLINDNPKDHNGTGNRAKEN